MKRKNFTFIAGSVACAALILLSGCEPGDGNLSELVRYAQEKISEGIGTGEKNTEQETVQEDSQIVSVETEETAETTENATEPAAEMLSADCYVYQTLPENVRTVYDEVYDAILHHKEDVAVSTLEQEILNQAYVSVMADHGGLFWVSGFWSL